MKRIISLFMITVLLLVFITGVLGINAGFIDAPFYDTSQSVWYFSNALYCYTYGYVKGVSTGYFSGDSYLTRAQAVQLLYAYSLSKESSSGSYFKDVLSSAWYCNAVYWAYENRITSGVGNRVFSPDSNITRQDFITLLYNYRSVFHSDREGEKTQNTIRSFKDNDKIAGYASDSIGWAIEYGLISGFPDKTVRPGNNITRAELVTIITVYDKSMGHTWKLDGYVTDRTCQSNGYANYVCTDCQAENNVVYESGHIKYLSASKKATCTENGYKKYSCYGCAETWTVEYSAKGHTWKKSTTVKPSYTNEGYTLYKCTVCSVQKKENIQPKYEYTAGCDSNKDGILTLDEYLGAYNIIEFLTAHKSDYIGTPYDSISHFWDAPWELIHNKGQYPYDAQMNCTGFVASVFYRCGSDFSTLAQTHSGFYVNGYNWYNTIIWNNIYHYTFYSVSEALNSGLLKKGDVFYFVPEGGSDCHLGIFWGDNPHDDKFWHSTMAYDNQITGIFCATRYTKIFVCPLQSN